MLASHACDPGSIPGQCNFPFAELFGYLPGRHPSSPSHAFAGFFAGTTLKKPANPSWYWENIYTAVRHADVQHVLPRQRQLGATGDEP
jgi:hypothetical protein